MLFSHTCFFTFLLPSQVEVSDIQSPMIEMWQAGVGGVRLQDVLSVSQARRT
jgi:hypothetical protein